MKHIHFEIKDHCRKGLLKYLERAISVLPKMEHPKVLDVGCGTGVPTLFILEQLGGAIIAADVDPEPLHFLGKKVKSQKLIDVISIVENSLFDLKRDHEQFDVIFAEGLLNVIGFKPGFEALVALTKKGGCMIIHDEFDDQEKKLKIIKRHNCDVLDSYVLDEQIWWNDYYKCLNKKIDAVSDSDLLELFESDVFEINAYHADPSNFKSLYYIIKKN